MVVLRIQRQNSAEDTLALVPSLRVLSNDTRSDLYLHTQAEDTSEQRSTGDTTFQLVDLGSGLVDVEGSDDDEFWGGGEVADGDGDALDDVLVYSIDVVFQLSGNRHDGRVLRNGSYKKTMRPMPHKNIHADCTHP